MTTLYKWSVAEYHHMLDAGLLEGKPVELLEGKIIEKLIPLPSITPNPNPILP